MVLRRLHTDCISGALNNSQSFKELFKGNLRFFFMIILTFCRFSAAGERNGVFAVRSIILQEKDMSVLKIKKWRENARVPFQATAGSAGMDLYACIGEAVTIPPHEIRVIPTGIAIELESPAYVAYIFARSGLAIKHGIAPANCVGVIDSDYRGEVCVGLVNQTQEPFTVQPDERIAQMVISPVVLPQIEVVDDLGDTARGAGGFGSTGKT